MAMQTQARTAGELWDEIRAVVDGLAPGDWSRPTPCARWDVKDLIAHITGLQTAMDGTAPQPAPPEGWAPEEGLGTLDVFTEAGVVARRGWSVERLREELEIARAGHVARFEAGDPDGDAIGPFGPTTMAKLHGFRMFDLWVHLQDLAMALGGKLDLHAESTAAQDGCRHVFASIPVLAAKRAGMTEGQRLAVRIGEQVPMHGVLVVTDGRAGWAADGDEIADDEADRVEVAPGALALLLAGRRGPEEWRADGALDWSGELGEAFVRRARVFGG